MILFVKHPIFAFQFYCRVVLLVRPLLVVESEKQGVKVKMSKVFASIEHGNGREHQVFVFQRDCVPRLIHLLVPYLRHISIGSA